MVEGSSGEVFEELGHSWILLSGRIDLAAQSLHISAGYGTSDGGGDGSAGLCLLNRAKCQLEVSGDNFIV